MSWISRFVASSLLIAVWPALAADDSRWSSVEALRQGDRIGIIQSNQKRLEGKFQSASDAGVTIHTDQDITVAKTEVVRVYTRPRVSRPMRTLIGAAAGLAAGAVVNGTVGQYFRNETGEDIAVGAFLGGAAVGAGLGAASGGGYHTVYRRVNALPGSTNPTPPSGQH